MQVSAETASRATLHMIAKLHYEGDMAQVAIAKKLGMSTATVSRLLQKARALGIVRIEVPDLAVPDEITGQLVEVLGLKRGAVVDTPNAGVLAALAPPLGRLLKEEDVQPGGVIGIGWGRAIREVVAAGLPSLPGVMTVALNGGSQESAPHFQINEFVRQAADQLGGSAHFLHAPHLSSAELRDAFLNDPSVRETTGLWDRLDCAIVGIGQPHAKNLPDPGAAVDGQSAGDVVGDVLRHYVDIGGGILPWEGEERMIAASADQLRNAKLSIGLAATPEKAAGIIGAARSGMINALVTDVATAVAILGLLARD